MPFLDAIALKDPSNWNEDIKFKLPMLLTDNNSKESLREFLELFKFLKQNEIQYTFFSLIQFTKPIGYLKKRMNCSNLKVI